MVPDERTVTFALWPHLITMEGPADRMAAVIEHMYANPRIARDQWSMANTDRIGRRAIAERLRGQGKVVRRVGLAALTLPVSNAIEGFIKGAGLKCNVMHMPSSTTGRAC